MTEFGTPFDPITSYMVMMVFILLLIWSLAWKGVALWKAGRNNDLAWFIILFLINTAGILDILYIVIIGKREQIHHDSTTLQG